MRSRRCFESASALSRSEPRTRFVQSFEGTSRLMSESRVRPSSKSDGNLVICAASLEPATGGDGEAVVAGTAPIDGDVETGWLVPTGNAAADEELEPVGSNAASADFPALDDEKVLVVVAVAVEAALALAVAVDDAESTDAAGDVLPGLALAPPFLAVYAKSSGAASRARVESASTANGAESGAAGPPNVASRTRRSSDLRCST